MLAQVKFADDERNKAFADEIRRMNDEAIESIMDGTVEWGS